MIGFLIKKSFFDGWDNLLTILILNIGFIICMAVIFFLPGIAEGALGSASALLMIPGILLFHIFGGAVSNMIRQASDFKAVELKGIVTGIKESWKISVIIGILNCIIFIILIVGIPFYLSLGNLAGVAGAGLIFWISLFWMLSIQFFFPLHTRMGGSFFVLIKKSMLIALDNPGVSIFALLYSIILGALSVVTAFMMPGITGILLFHQNTVKLRLYKYDWLEENPGGDRKNIPWDALLYEDREKIGPRSLKGMIFPWKD